MGVQSTSNSFLETFYFFSFPRLAGRGLLGHGQILLAKMLLRSLKYLSGLWVKAKQSFEKCARVEFHRATWTAGEGPGYHCWCTEASLSRILSYTSFSPLDKGPGILPLHESDGGQQRCQCRICNRNAHLTTWGQSWPGMSLYAARSGPGTTQSKTTQNLLLSTKISSQCRSKLAGPLVLLESTHYLGTYGKAYVVSSRNVQLCSPTSRCDTNPLQERAANEKATYYPGCQYRSVKREELSYEVPTLRRVMVRF
ncbi:hypothetical protein DFH94DRAFT_682200 [Russula ochroleuca]|uniref:Uncharacterized protein n=1 Tax=Russula ochroleuca TaxID=152965 RepID=A0A9P5MWN1_9AGAM|nr:hypothetical protein DFH94DRAFT_682200 [Russula ochroleuca]